MADSCIVRKKKDFEYGRLYEWEEGNGSFLETFTSIIYSARQGKNEEFEGKAVFGDLVTYPIGAGVTAPRKIRTCDLRDIPFYLPQLYSSIGSPVVAYLNPRKDGNEMSDESNLLTISCVRIRVTISWKLQKETKDRIFQAILLALGQLRPNDKKGCPQPNIVVYDGISIDLLFAIKPIGNFSKPKKCVKALIYRLCRLVQDEVDGTGVNEFDGSGKGFVPYAMVDEDISKKLTGYFCLPTYASRDASDTPTGAVIFHEEKMDPYEEATELTKVGNNTKPARKSGGYFSADGRLSTLYKVADILAGKGQLYNNFALLAIMAYSAYATTGESVAYSTEKAKKFLNKLGIRLSEETLAEALYYAIEKGGYKYSTDRILEVLGISKSEARKKGIGCSPEGIFTISTPEEQENCLKIAAEEDLNVMEIAAKTGRSPSWVSRTLKKNHAKTQVQEARDHAQNLIAAGVPIPEAAKIAGISYDAAYRCAQRLKRIEAETKAQEKADAEAKEKEAEEESKEKEEGKKESSGNKSNSSDSENNCMDDEYKEMHYEEMDAVMKEFMESEASRLSIERSMVSKEIKLFLAKNFRTKSLAVFRDLVEAERAMAEYADILHSGRISACEACSRITFPSTIIPQVYLNDEQSAGSEKESFHTNWPETSEERHSLWLKDFYSWKSALKKP